MGPAPLPQCPPLGGCSAKEGVSLAATRSPLPSKPRSPCAGEQEGPGRTRSPWRMPGHLCLWCCCLALPGHPFASPIQAWQRPHHPIPIHPRDEQGHCACSLAVLVLELQPAPAQPHPAAPHCSKSSKHTGSRLPALCLHLTHPPAQGTRNSPSVCVPTVKLPLARGFGLALCRGMSLSSHCLGPKCQRELWVSTHQAVQATLGPCIQMLGWGW